MQKILLLPLFYRWKHGGTERSRKSSKVIRPPRARLWFGTLAFCHQTPSLNHWDALPLCGFISHTRVIALPANLQPCNVAHTANPQPMHCSPYPQHNSEQALSGGSQGSHPLPWLYRESQLQLESNMLRAMMEERTKAHGGPETGEISSTWGVQKSIWFFHFCIPLHKNKIQNYVHILGKSNNLIKSGWILVVGKIHAHSLGHATS